MNKDGLEKLMNQPRSLQTARVGDTTSDQAEKLGPLKHLPGTWKSLPGRGWNMIALPFETQPDSPLNYRLLLNQYDEELRFKSIDDPVLNRGLSGIGPNAEQSDQIIVALDYEQMIRQIAVDDFPPITHRGAQCLPIHHEPGLWLHMLNETTDGLDIARLATIPHGDALLALGKSDVYEGAPLIPEITGLPDCVPPDLSNPYLAPYAHFHDDGTPEGRQRRFEGLFDPVKPNELLNAANRGVDIVRTTALHVDTAIETAGIRNIPFIVKQADATDMQFTLWIQELADKDDAGNPMIRLQYSQVVFLEFFDCRDGRGRIRWPHVSINTLVRSDQVDPVHVCGAMMPPA